MQAFISSERSALAVARAQLTAQFMRDGASREQAQAEAAAIAPLPELKPSLAEEKEQHAVEMQTTRTAHHNKEKAAKQKKRRAANSRPTSASARALEDPAPGASASLGESLASAEYVPAFAANAAPPLEVWSLSSHVRAMCWQASCAV